MKIKLILALLFFMPLSGMKQPGDSECSLLKKCKLDVSKDGNWLAYLKALEYKKYLVESLQSIYEYSDKSFLQLLPGELIAELVNFNLENCEAIKFLEILDGIRDDVVTFIKYKINDKAYNQLNEGERLQIISHIIEIMQQKDRGMRSCPSACYEILRKTFKLADFKWLADSDTIHKILLKALVSIRCPSN